MMRIIKNDTVKVISGNHKGKVGKVLKVFPKTRRIVVEKVALVKRHRKPRSQTDQGGILEKEASIHISNVLPVDPKTNQPTRVGFRKTADGSKERFAKKSGETLGIVRKAK